MAQLKLTIPPCSYKQSKSNLHYHKKKYFICRQIPSDKPLTIKIETNACKGQNTEVNYLEHVQAVLTVNATRRGDLELFLTSPMGTRSMILSRRQNDDDSRDGFTKWPFMTTHTWGEYPQGTWLLEVTLLGDGFWVFVVFRFCYRWISIRRCRRRVTWKSGRWCCTEQRNHLTQVFRCWIRIRSWR